MCFLSMASFLPMSRATTSLMRRCMSAWRNTAAPRFVGEVIGVKSELDVDCEEEEEDCCSD